MRVSVLTFFFLVEGEMDRLRILTTDLGSIPNIADLGQIKSEPLNSCHTSQIITIKQELPSQQFFVKSEPDTPQFTPDDHKVS